MKTMAVNTGLTNLRQVIPSSDRFVRDMGPSEYLGQVGPVRDGLYRRRAKRWLDIGLTVLLVLPVTLIVAIIALLVAIDGGRPFYVQPRVGRGGRTFPMFKIRTMVRDAEAVLKRHLEDDPSARAEWLHRQKLRHDPRITPLGRFLRRTSLDELPQFYNVLRGDMTLVGPRPFLPEQKAYYDGEEYYLMRPGITGFWQTSERNEASFVQRVAYDRCYYHALSPLTDIRVIGRTLKVVLRGTGM
ncbi:MAG: sugar transferase [Limimaricola soesokkakensis]|uniref:sugar transferase n=1 Tax=Limimaricola soesokkakensis TaxID=1343159 RepID=UPI004057FAE6